MKDYMSSLEDENKKIKKHKNKSNHKSLLVLGVILMIIGFAIFIYCQSKSIYIGSQLQDNFDNGILIPGYDIDVSFYRNELIKINVIKRVGIVLCFIGFVLMVTFAITKISESNSNSNVETQKYNQNNQFVNMNNNTSSSFTAKFCPSCGKEINPSFKYCTNCGNKIK